MDVSKVTPDILTERLDAEFYRPSFLSNHRLLTALKKRSTLGEASTAIKLGYTGPIDDCYSAKGALFLTSKNIVDGCVVVGPDTLRIRFDVHNGKLSSTVARSGDLLFSRTGTVGKAAVLHDGEDHYNFAAHLFAVRVKTPFDSGYLGAFFNSPYGSLQSERMQRGTIIQGLSIYDMPGMIVPNHSELAQNYIGDKVRQAERLCKVAFLLQTEIDSLLVTDAIRDALGTPDSMTNRVNSQNVDGRLDAKYYGARARSVFAACFQQGGVQLSELNPDVTNGFEYRQFIDSGRRYITVSEVSSGRIDLSNAPRIPTDLFVPAKGQLNTRCVLAVRGGSVGFAAKAHQEDCDAVVSSDLIRLEFGCEEMAAAVGLFLNSPAGQCLQHKVAYGGVMPKLGQDELLKTPIPRIVVEKQGPLLVLFNKRESALRGSQRLVIAAKYLVDSLIEGKITEDELVAAQQAINRGDRTLDLAILSRLTEDGMDVADKPKLFADLDALYAIFDETQRTQPSNGDAT